MCAASACSPLSTPRSVQLPRQPTGTRSLPPPSTQDVPGILRAPTVKQCTKYGPAHRQPAPWQKGSPGTSTQHQSPYPSGQGHMLCPQSHTDEVWWGAGAEWEHLCRIMETAGLYSKRHHVQMWGQQLPELPS